MPTYSLLCLLIYGVLCLPSLLSIPIVSYAYQLLTRVHMSSEQLLPVAVVYEVTSFCISPLILRRRLLLYLFPLEPAGYQL